jgi:flagellar basal body rod protein FlgC
MFNQSITGIKSNLEAFNQAAAKIAQPQTTEVLAGKPDRQASRATGPRLAITPADQTAGKPPDKTSTTRRPARAQDANAPRETANEPGTRSRASQVVDQAQETVNMMVAQRGVEANLGVLKTAQSLSGQTVNILA